MGKADLQVNFRMPAELKAGLEDSAEANARSLTAEIVHRLRESLDGKAVVLPDEFRARLLADATKHGWPFESELLHTLADALDPPQDLRRLPTVQELEHRAAALATELELLRELARSQQKTIQAQEVNVIMLATHIVDIVNSLPPRVRQERAVKEATDFALSLDIGEKLLALHGPTGQPIQAKPANGGENFEIPPFLRKAPPKATPKPPAKKRR